MFAVVIAVDRLSKQRDLGGALIREARHLANHVGQLATPLRSARHRNDAERAPIIAAALHGHEGGDGIGAHRRDILVMLPALEVDVGGALAVARSRDQLRQPAIPIRADDEIHLGHELEEFGPQPLRHTADDTEHVARTLEALQFPHAAQHPLLRMIPDGTGVDQ
jgi:hypothetical protein